MTNVNYKSDFDFVLDLLDSSGGVVGWPLEDFRAVLYVAGKEARFEASSLGGRCTNCRNDDGHIRIVANNHGLGIGQLWVEFTLYSPDESYPDGVRAVTNRAALDIELVPGLTDESIADRPATMPMPVVISADMRADMALLREDVDNCRVDLDELSNQHDEDISNLYDEIVGTDQWVQDLEDEVEELKKEDVSIKNTLTGYGRSIREVRDTVNAVRQDLADTLQYVLGIETPGDYDMTPLYELAENYHGDLYDVRLAAAATIPLPMKAGIGEAEFYRRLHSSTEDVETLLNDIEYTAALYDKWTYGTTAQNDKKLVYAPALKYKYPNGANDLNGAFTGCTTLRDASGLDGLELGTGNHQDLFYKCANLVRAPKLKIRGGNCWSLFQSCIKIKEVDVSQWDMSKIWHARSLFSACNELERVVGLPTTGFDFSGVTFSSLAQIFSDCFKFTVDGTGILRIRMPKCMPEDIYWWSGMESITELYLTGCTTWTNNTKGAFIIRGFCAARTGHTMKLKKIDTFNFRYACEFQRLFEGCSELVYLKAVNLGQMRDITNGHSDMPDYIPLGNLTAWGTGGDENLATVRYTLIEYSYDRAKAGWPTLNLELSAATKALLTQSEIAAITAKGYNIV